MPRDPLRRSRRPAAAALLALLALAACNKRSLINADSPDSPPYEVKVVDAEVIIVDGTRVQLSNIDAPALVPTARCWGEAVAAREAVRFVQTMVDNGRVAEVRIERDAEGMGRAFGRVLIDGLDVGDALYEQSLAARPGERPFRWCEPMSDASEGAPPMDPVLAITR